jgi:hypothetical protein
VENVAINLILSYEINTLIFGKSSPMEFVRLTAHPMLDLFNRPNLDETSSSVSAGKKLYLIPSTHGDSFDPDFAPNPSPLSELPNIERWTLMYIVSALEILAGRRSPQQVARSTHRFTYNTILQKVGTLTELPKIKRIHRHQPIEGVIEVTVTLTFKDRVRALVARFEGVDRKWLCTELDLL